MEVLDSDFRPSHTGGVSQLDFTVSSKETPIQVVHVCREIPAEVISTVKPGDYKPRMAEDMQAELEALEASQNRRKPVVSPSWAPKSSLPLRMRVEKFLTDNGMTIRTARMHVGEIVLELRNMGDPSLASIHAALDDLEYLEAEEKRRRKW